MTTKTRQTFTPAARELFARLSSEDAASVVFDVIGFTRGDVPPVSKLLTPAQRRAHQRSVQRARVEVR